MKNKADKLIYEQYVELINEGAKDILAKIAYYIALGIIPLAIYLKFLKQSGDESKVPSVIDQAEQIKQQIPIPRGSTIQDLKDMGDWDPEENGGMGPVNLTRQDITMGRTIHLQLIFSDIGVKARWNALDSQPRTSADQYEFLKRLIYGKLGEPPYRGTQEEWDAYVDTIYAFDWTKWIA